MAESKAGIQSFHDEHYRDAHEAYIRWLRHNPRGFVLNLKTSTWAVLHESDCMHKEWAAERGMRWTRCGTCFG